MPDFDEPTNPLLADALRDFADTPDAETRTAVFAEFAEAPLMLPAKQGNGPLAYGRITPEDGESLEIIQNDGPHADGRQGKVLERSAFQRTQPGGVLLRSNERFRAGRESSVALRDAFQFCACEGVVVRESEVLHSGGLPKLLQKRLRVGDASEEKQTRVRGMKVEQGLRVVPARHAKLVIW